MSPPSRRRERSRGPVDAELRRQKTANRNTLPLYDAFENHRTHLTRLALDAAPRAGGSLCVLGAGNCYDLDLQQLAGAYERIHLVDIDEQALRGVRQRLDPKTRQRLVLHAPVDLSGLTQCLPRWAQMRVTPDELIAHVGTSTEAIVRRLGGAFHVVLSACLLSQMHLMVRRILTDRHPLFEAIGMTLTITHLRTLARLTRPGARAIFATDVASDEIAPLACADPLVDGPALMAQLLATDSVFQVVDPRWIRMAAAEDPMLRSEVDLSPLLDVWLWQLGPRRTLLVYALELLRANDAVDGSNVEHSLERLGV